MKRLASRSIKLLAVCLCVALLASCSWQPAGRGEPGGDPAPLAPVQPAPKPPEPQPPAPEPEPEPTLIRIVAAGDNLLHNTLSMASQTADGYDFSPLYRHIAPLVSDADIAFINQEVMLTGEAGKYPLLSAPFEAGDAVREAGFTVVNLATNHSLDKGEKGLLRSVEYVNTLGFDAVLGAYATQEEAEKYQVIEKQGVKFGFLSYTYGLNGMSVPEDKPWMVSLIDEEKMDADIEAITPLCDYLIVSMHWGVEYQHTPSDRQKELAQFLCDRGVDLIIGHHPHVLQPMEVLTNEAGEQTICVYSLGNLISGQHERATMLGGLFVLELEAGEDGITVKSKGIIPTVTHYYAKVTDVTIYPLDEYSDELTAVHAVKDYSSPVSVEYFTGLAQDVLGENLLSWRPDFD